MVFFYVSFIGKPIPDKTNITLGVTFTTGIEFSIKIIAYPEPSYELVYENGTRNNQMMNYITQNAVNNFTVNFRQSVVDQKSFGLYYLTMRNVFGESTVTVNLIEQSKWLDISSLNEKLNLNEKHVYPIQNCILVIITKCVSCYK